VVTSGNGASIDPAILPTGGKLGYDAAGQQVILFNDEWSCNFFAERNGAVELSALPAESRHPEPELVA
jgi:peptide subunit release factor RF-3